MEISKRNKININKNLIIMILIIYSTMFLFGMTENIKGVSFPLIKDAFGVAYTSQGGLVSSSWFGYVLFCVVATFSLERYGSKKSLGFGYVFVCLGCLLVSFSNGFYSVNASLMILWMGFGFFEVGSNAMATTVFKSNSAIYMNLMHFFYGFGAVLGPKFAGIAVEKFDVGFKGIYLITLVPMVIVLSLIMFSKANQQNESESSSMTIKEALRNKYVWMFAICLGFMEVIEFSAANWGSFYLRDAFGINPLKLGATFVSVYYIFFTISRLCSGFAIEKIGYIKSIIISLISIFVLYIIGFLFGSKGIWLLASTGLFSAIMWPTLMCIAMDIFKQESAIATSVIIVISGSINGIMQLATGIINEYIGNLWGYRLSALYVLIPIYFMLLIAKKSKKNTHINA